MTHRRLSKEESRARFAEARKIWNEFDPIGVVDAVDDEYDMYVGPTLRLCEEGKGPEAIRTYAEFVVYDRMGFRRPFQNKDEQIKRFSERFHAWYLASWSDTIV